MFSPCLSALLISEALFIYIVKFVSPCNTVVGVCSLLIGGAGSTIINHGSHGPKHFLMVFRNEVMDYNGELNYCCSFLAMVDI